MGWLKPINIAILVLAVAASVTTLQFYSASADQRAASFAARDVGPWKLGAIMIAGIGDTSDPIRPGAWSMVLVQYCDGCLNEIKRLWVNVGLQPAGPKGQRVSGQPGFARAGLKLPERIDADTRLWMTAEGWNGQLHHASWPIVKEQERP